ncbi:MAG: aminoacyl-tRNA hydrolase [Oscillospiraceae bacterium]|nr:aminoacyl-tRNA hydrolase [Oscillospiraceae bacterium]
MFKSWKSKSAGMSSAPEYMVVGLGNPGKKYEFTRHNAGFLTLDLLAMNESVKIDRLKFKSLLGDTTLGGHRCILLKPQTFMNNSGEAVRQAADFYKIPPGNILVIFDDISLPCGKLRIRRKGSDGGHNGVKSIIRHLNSDEFPRIKLGIGDRPNPEWELMDWVLSPFKKDELKLLREASDHACKAAELIVRGEIENAMGLYN